MGNQIRGIETSNRKFPQILSFLLRKASAETLEIFDWMIDRTARVFENTHRFLSRERPEKDPNFLESRKRWGKNSLTPGGDNGHRAAVRYPAKKKLISRIKDNKEKLWWTCYPC